MKTKALLLMLVIVISFWSCGSNSEKKENTAESKKEILKEKDKIDGEIIRSLIIIFEFNLRFLPFNISNGS